PDGMQGWHRVGRRRLQEVASRPTAISPERRSPGRALCNACELRHTRTVRRSLVARRVHAYIGGQGRRGSTRRPVRRKASAMTRYSVCSLPSMAHALGLRLGGLQAALCNPVRRLAALSLFAGVFAVLLPGVAAADERMYLSRHEIEGSLIGKGILS